MIKIIILGIIQGLTEFLPVSSSGHLAVFERLFNITSDNLFLETAMHLGTLFSLLVYFRKKIIDLVTGAYREIRNRESNKASTHYMLYVIIGILPAAIAGILFNEHIKNAFSNMIIVGMLFIVTGCILLGTRWVKHANTLNGRNALLIGIMQIFALLPGISRSGMTISTGVFAGLKREDAADFSFFMAMPLILGSFIKEFIDAGMSISLEIIVGIVVSFVSGYAAIILLYKILKTRKFYLFSIYMIPMGIAVILYGFFI